MILLNFNLTLTQSLRRRIFWQILPESPIDLRPMVMQAYEMLPELKAIPLDFAMRAVEEFMGTDDARQATAEGLRIFLKSMRDGAAPIRQAIYRAFNENV